MPVQGTAASVFSRGRPDAPAAFSAVFAHDGRNGHVVSCAAVLYFISYRGGWRKKGRLVSLLAMALLGVVGFQGVSYSDAAVLMG